MLYILLFILILMGVLLLINWLLSKSELDEEKLSSYECGFLPFSGQTRAPFNIQFYIVGILFLIFDIEIAILYPLVGSEISSYNLIIALIILIILTIGFVYE